ncbi:OsmC family protein [Arthrobacter pigmenti]
MTETAVKDLTTERADRLNEAGEFWDRKITEDTANAKLTYTANGEGVGSVATRVTAGKHVFHIDEPAGLAGDDEATSPVEAALGALISCQVVVYRLYAHQLGITVDGIDIAAEGDLDVRGIFGKDDAVRPGFGEVRLKVNISGPESAERYEELRQAVDAHCPVLDLLNNPTPVTSEVVKV